MKLTTHSMNNDVFASLLEGLGDSVIVKQKQAEPQPNVSGKDVFSSTTEETMSAIMSDKLDFLSKELDYASQTAHVSLTGDDYNKFAQTIAEEGLKGKDIERAAKKYCNEIDRNRAAPKSASKMSNVDSDQVQNTHQVYSTDGSGITDSKTGGFIGMKSSPNTIWDSDALQRLATQKTPDEKLREANKARAEAKEEMKKNQWKDAVTQAINDPNNIQKGILAAKNYGGDTPPVVDQKLSNKGMSIFSDDRDFSHIPAQTKGETIKAAAEARSNKAEQARAQGNPVKAAVKTDNSLSELIAEINKPTETDSRASLDKLFENLA